MQVSERNKWYTNERVSNELVGWMHMKFPKPMVLNAFALRSANDVPARDPKNVRVFAKIPKDDDKNELDFGEDENKDNLLEGFELIGEVKDMKFDRRWQ